MSKKNPGIFDKVKSKSGVIEGGIEQFNKEFNTSNKGVRINFTCPDDIHKKYKMLLTKRGLKMQDDLLEYVTRLVRRNPTENEDN